MMFLDVKCVPAGRYGKGGLGNLLFAHIHGGDAAGLVEVTYVSEAGFGHQGFEFITGREFKHRLGEVVVGALFGEETADGRQDLEEIEKIDRPEHR